MCMHVSSDPSLFRVIIIINVMIANTGVFVSLATMDATFVMEVAMQNLTTSDLWALGLLLKVDTSAIQAIMRGSYNLVTKSCKLLEAWLDSRTSDSPSVLYDELSQAFVDMARADLVNFVRQCV